MHRRHLITRTLPAIAGACLTAPAPIEAATTRRILLRPGSFQRGNIGDISHSLGTLRLFDLHFPQAQITLWPRGISEEARATLKQFFPKLRIVEGDLDAQGRPSTPALQTAWQESDLLLHGSAPGFKGMGYMPAWRRTSSKPYGVFGITDDPLFGIGGGRIEEGGTLEELRAALDALPVSSLSPATLEVLNGAAFIFCRETLTQHHFRRQGVRCPILEFGPDATFAMHLRDETRAAAYLEEQSLQPGGYLCIIPRLRYTPTTLAEGAKPSSTVRAKDTINTRTAEIDHAKMRGLIIQWVRETGLKVLACPEMTYQVPLAKRLLVDPLPDDVKPRVVWRDHYWQPDEAAAIYQRAASLVSFECHSPILALAAGTPAIYVRQPTDTVKGRMYHDIGASAWTCEVDEIDGANLWARVRKIHTDPAAARRQVASIMAGVRRVQQRMVEAVQVALS